MTLNEDPTVEAKQYNDGGPRFHQTTEYLLNKSI